MTKNIKIKNKKLTLISTIVFILFILFGTSFYISNYIVLGGRDIISEEMDYCHFLQNHIDGICSEGKIKVIPRTGREYVQTRTIEFQILDSSNDLNNYVQILTDVCKNYSLKYFSYIILDNKTKKRIILQEQLLKYYYKSNYYIIYMRLCLYVMKHGHYPRKINELSNFSYYEKKVKTIDVSTYLLINSKHCDIKIRQMQEECMLSIIDTYPINCTKIESNNKNDNTSSNITRMTNCSVILSDGKLLSWNYYRREFNSVP